MAVRNHVISSYTLQMDSADSFNTVFDQRLRTSIMKLCLKILKVQQGTGNHGGDEFVDVCAVASVLMAKTWH
jgi:hypothetical protein